MDRRKRHLGYTPKIRAIEEEAANFWRWHLKTIPDRLSQVRGDFHPFSILFTIGSYFNLLDRSRGEWGESADDVSCLMINYLFFCLQQDSQLNGAFQQLSGVSMIESIPPGFVIWLTG